jgi:hypothetical protein
MFATKLLGALSFDLTHVVFIAFSILLQDMLDLRKGNNREEFREQEVAGEEQTECTHVEADLPDRRSIISTPGRRQVITVYRGYDDHKTLEPHTDIHEDGHEEGHEQVSSHFAEPEDLG